MRDEKIIKEIASERITRLIELSEKTYLSKNPDPILCKRYVALAREIGSHYKIRIPRSEKLKFCKKCDSVLIPGRNCTVRLSKASAIYKCDCGNETRFFYGRKGKHSDK